MSTSVELMITLERTLKKLHLVDNIEAVRFIASLSKRELGRLRNLRQFIHSQSTAP